MILISSSLSLLAIVAGMFLYAKTIKEELSRLFKIVACFIVVVGFLNLFIGCAFFTIKTIYKCGTHHYKMEKMLHDHHGSKMKKHKGKCMSAHGMRAEGCNTMMMDHRNKMEMMVGNDCCSASKKMVDGSSMLNGKHYCEEEHRLMKKDSSKKKR